MLTPTDKLNIICFIILTIIAIVSLIVVIKLKPPGVWKFQIVWICITEAAGVFLLVTRLLY